MRLFFCAVLKIQLMMLYLHVFRAAKVAIVRDFVRLLSAPSTACRAEHAATWVHMQAFLLLRALIPNHFAMQNHFCGE